MHVISVSVSTEILKDSLVSAGTKNGIQAYYSYGGNIVLNYSITAYMTSGEISTAENNISNNGYNSGGFMGFSGNITSVSPSSRVFIGGVEHWSTSVSVKKNPPYRSPSFGTTSESEFQTKIAGYYINGKAYISNEGNSGKITKKKMVVSAETASSLEVSPKSSFGQTIESFILSVNISNYRYIVGPSGSGTLIADAEIITVE
jgi:hypothetical protein